MVSSTTAGVHHRHWGCDGSGKSAWKRENYDRLNGSVPCASHLLFSRRAFRIPGIAALGIRSLFPAFRPIVLHPVRDRLLCLG